MGMRRLEYVELEKDIMNHRNVRAKLISEAIIAYCHSLLKTFEGSEKKEYYIDLSSFTDSFFNFVWDTPLYRKIVYWEEYSSVEMSMIYNLCSKIIDELYNEKFYLLPYSFDEDKPEKPLEEYLKMYEKFPSFLSGFGVRKK